MRFRTEIEIPKSPFRIAADTPLLMLGSCFTDEIGSRLASDGFEVLHNPFGALYNPLSIANCVQRALSEVPYSRDDLVEGPRGFHCLDYSTRFSGRDPVMLLSDIREARLDINFMLYRKPVVIITLGSAFVFERADTGKIVGNCHKFPASFFNRRRLSVEETTEALEHIVEMVAPLASALVFTVSPIRHVADGLHGNNLSKATLLLACDNIVNAHPDVFYFPAYEALVDDLRDYRFYGADMKHPSEVAVDYIYELFSATFFDADTRKQALQRRREYLASLHRPIL